MQIGSLAPASRRTPWVESYKLVDDEDDSPVDLSDASEIKVEIFDQMHGHAALTASLSTGSVELIETGVFQWTFTQQQMQTLRPQAYDVNITITKDDLPISILVGSLPIVDRFSSTLLR